MWLDPHEHFSCSDFPERLRIKIELVSHAPIL